MSRLKHYCRVYISKSLKDALGGCIQYRYNFICAPSGYGKSAVCHDFFKNYPGYEVCWQDGDDNNFTLREHTIVIVDHAEKILSDDAVKKMCQSYGKDTDDVHFIFLLRGVCSHRIIEMATKRNVGFIGADELKFTPEDIFDYLARNEVAIDMETANRIYAQTLGWPYMIELFMDICKAENKFYHKPAGHYRNIALDNIHMTEAGKAAMERGDAFISNNIWYGMDDKQQDFLINLSVFDRFTISQCCAQTLSDERQCVDNLNRSALLTCDNSRRYSFNPIFREFLLRVLNERPIEQVNKIITRAADVYLDVGDYFYAIRLYARAEEFEKIYACNAKLGSIYAYITKDNKKMFLDIANHYWNTDKHGNYRFSTILCFILFMYNERTFVQDLMRDIRHDIEREKTIDAPVKSQHYAELEYISAFLSFNDFGKMNEHFYKVSHIIKSPEGSIGGQYPFLFECPSVLFLYHRKEGDLDLETALMQECAPDYYRITNGHGKGFEALMKAEVLYNRGDIDSAEILCHKAIYMADSRNQIGIYMGAVYLLVQIAIYHGSDYEFKAYMDNIAQQKTDVEYLSSYLQKMIDICQSLVYINLSEADKVKDWLRDERTIEKRCNFMSLCHVNIILGRYLIITQDYHKFLGISGQLLGLSKVHPFILPRIYTYIYLSIANYEMGEQKKAHKFLSEAVALSVHDRLYMPFVHNYSYIGEMLEETAIGKDVSAFVKEVRRHAKIYEKGVKAIMKADRVLTEYGLTVREADVARLAAQRLSNKEIADQLFIAESTVKSNMKMIFSKLQIRSRAELRNYFDQST